ncbi:uncharacterized protein LOC142355856 [Convolutriloba macropyga]|uniref:uncharacterized protein LOC142355856 n=1 Tax=Convolutriloba macropyga TaxID=536237 RepID=UPI003F521D54
MNYFAVFVVSFVGLAIHQYSVVGVILQYESIPEEIDTRSLREFVVDTVEDTHTERRCGMQCTKNNYCKSYNHNEDGALCELIMTDYRLLEKPRVDGNISLGWRHYSKVTYPRGCVGKVARDCVQFWVKTALTSDVSITCAWILSDGEETVFLAQQEPAHS